MGSTKTDPINFSYKGAAYVKDADGCIKFKGYNAGAEINHNQISLSNMIIGSSSVEGTPLWNLVFDPNYDVTTIRVSGSVIKVKNYFIRENNNSTVFLHGNNIFVKITITNGDIDEYESLPSRPCKKADYSAVAWLVKNGKYLELHHKPAREGSIC